MKKVTLLTLALYGTLSFSGAFASDGLDINPSHGHHVSSEDIDSLQSLYTKYLPENPTKEFFADLKKSHKASLNGHLYTVSTDDATHISGSGYSSASRLLGNDTTPILQTFKLDEKTFTKDGFFYHFSYTIKRSISGNAGTHDFKVFPKLSEDDAMVWGQIRARHASQMAQLSDNFGENDDQRIESFFENVMDEFEALPELASESFESNAIVPYVAVTEEEARQEKTRLQQLLEVAEYVSKNEAIRETIRQIDLAIENQAREEFGDCKIVILANTLANYYGYSSVGNVLYEESTGEKRQNDEDKYNRIANAFWVPAGYIIPGAGSVRYLSQAAANLTVGSDNVTKAYVGISNGKSPYENRVQAAANMVKAGVATMPMGGMVIAVSGAVAKHILNEESLTQAAIHRVLGKDEA